jgi:hypothetical protein
VHTDVLHPTTTHQETKQACKVKTTKILKFFFTMCNVMSHYKRTGMMDVKWKATASANVQDPPQPLLTNIT